MTKHNHSNKSCSACATDIFEKKEIFWKQKKILVIIIAGLMLSLGLYIEFILKQQFFAQTLFLIVVLISGYNIIKKGFLSVIKLKFNMNFLITIASVGAFLIGHGEEGAAVIFLFFVAEFLEDYAADRARKSVASLLKLSPEKALVRRNGKEIEEDIHKIKVGEIIIIKSGDRIPLDGVIIKGTSLINQAPITGESMPVEKVKGNEIFAGTINEEGYLEIKVTKKINETTLSKIIKFVENAQKRKSKSEKFIDKFAKYYTPSIIFLSFMVMIVPTLFFGLPFNEWFYRGLVLLVVSCPCALAISTPISMVSGITFAAKNGVLIKGGNYVESMRKVKIIVFDKTGTLTEGKPCVTNIIPLNNYSEKDVLQIAASFESKSKHPIAKAIIISAKNKKIKLKNLSSFRSITGRGIMGQINGKQYYVGSVNYFKSKNIDLPNKIIDQLTNKGKTLVLVGNNNHIVGIIALMDKVREESKKTINKLKNQNIKTVMLTGDNYKTAKAIAQELSIDDFYSELMPKEKVKMIEKFIKNNNKVAMVGDGINDAPALAKANVGIAMGAIGSDVAIETADIALMDDDLFKITELIDLSKKTMAIIKQNVTLSIIIKSSFAILAFPGIITLWLAVAIGDMGLTLAVILNSLRIGRKK